MKNLSPVESIHMQILDRHGGGAFDRGRGRDFLPRAAVGVVPSSPAVALRRSTRYEATVFTGIVTAVGRIERATPSEGGLRLAIDPRRLDMRDVRVGDSIAVNGVCLTVVALAGARFEVDVSRESIACTVGLGAPGEANLEKSLTLADRLGGHLVTGHVDGVGEVVAFDAVGDNRRLVVRAPQGLAKYIARKGSIAVQGVSLTVNQVAGAEFEINLIPHTLDATTLKHLAPGGRVNLEVDLIARYVERMLGAATGGA
jgi:riboflavin synthase